MSNNLLIVESMNDQFFIEAVVSSINGGKLESSAIFVNEFESLEGLSQKSLSNKLKEVARRIEKDDLEHIGILIDADSKGVSSRLQLITDSLQTVDSSLEITEVNTQVKSNKLDVTFTACITHVDEIGELETLLRTIKSKSSPQADCLESWKICVESKGLTVSQKQLDKFWVSIYNRNDCCSNRERGQIKRKCTFEPSMKKDIWDFNHPVLSDIRTFLNLFN